MAHIKSRIFGGSGKIKYKGTITALSLARKELAAASIGSYALFAGGMSFTSPANDNRVDAYNTSLTRSTATALSTPVGELASAVVGDYALFAGGQNWGTGGGVIGTVNAYNASLTRSNPTSLSINRMYLGGIGHGNYAIFAGGITSSGYTTVGQQSNRVDLYNASLTRSLGTNLRQSVCCMGVAANDTYALFAGGRNMYPLVTSTGAVQYSDVTAYNKSMTMSAPTSMGSTRYGLAGACCNNNIIFTNGPQSSLKTVDIYNASLTHSTSATLSAGRIFPTGVSSKNYAVFAGGSNSSVSLYNNVDIYDKNLTHTTAMLNTAREMMAGTNLKSKYIIFAGGGCWYWESGTRNNYSQFNIAEAFSIR